MIKKSLKAKLKKASLVIGMLLLVMVAYIEIMNRNTRDMTYRQKVLKAFYPTLMWFNKTTGLKMKETAGQKKIIPPESFYDLSVTLNDGSVHPLSEWAGKKILLVNTASNCGYTNQYAELQQLCEANREKLIIIAFPANDFKEQEKGTDKEIAQFCQLNFGVSFPIARKASVIKGSEQQAIFQWLTEKNKNGWNDQQPNWNFSKYLVSETGTLLNYFDPAISPLSDQIKNAID